MARKKYEEDFREAVKEIKKQHDEIEFLKDNANKSENIISEVKVSQARTDYRVTQTEFYVNKSYYLACENRQKNSKGNLILSGRHIPRANSGENLVNIIRDIVFKKYEVNIHPNEFKIAHRLPGDRILFAFHNRLPGFAYDQLVQMINSNPKKEIEAYLSIQLFEPYSDLFFIARRLKFYKVISYYRLDENGQTYIALKEDTKAFKLTNLDQLSQLGVTIPQEVYNEVYQKKLTNSQLEAEAAAKMLSRANEKRPDIQSNPSSRRQYTHKSNSSLGNSMASLKQVQNREILVPHAESNVFYSERNPTVDPNRVQSTSFQVRPGFRHTVQDQGRRLSSKRGRSASYFPTSAQMSFPQSTFRFPPPASEQPRETVKDSCGQ